MFVLHLYLLCLLLLISVTSIVCLYNSISRIYCESLFCFVLYFMYTSYFVSVCSCLCVLVMVVLYVCMCDIVIDMISLYLISVMSYVMYYLYLTVSVFSLVWYGISVTVVGVSHVNYLVCSSITYICYPSGSPSGSSPLLVSLCALAYYVVALCLYIRCVLSFISICISLLQLCLYRSLGSRLHFICVMYSPWAHVLSCKIMLCNLIMLRYLLIVMMCVSVFEIIKDYRLISIISIVNLIVLFVWPFSIKEISLIVVNFIVGYKISIGYNYVGIYFSIVLDILIWISLLYERFYISNKNFYWILLLYLVNNVFFSSNDMICLSIIYEFQNIPLLIIINNLYNKINMYNKKGIGISNVLLILYGLVSGLLLYNSLYYLYLVNNNGNVLYNLLILSNFSDCSVLQVISSDIDSSLLNYVMVLLFISGSIKLSLFPFHMWLGKVHVEAPTIGSIILAGIALKTGFYLHYLFFSSFVYISNHIVSISMCILLIGLIVNNVNIFYQIDMKRWIALYSIVHMNLYYILLLLILYNCMYLVDISYIYMVYVVIYGMIGHSLISGGLFLVVGYLYDISNNKNILNVSNNIVSSYLYMLLFVLLLANSSFPFFILFLFELLALTLSSLHNLLLVIFLLLLSFSNLLSCLYMFCKYFFNHTSNSILYVSNSDLLVLIISLPILVLTFGMGINLFLPISYLI